MVEGDQGWSYEFHVCWLRCDYRDGFNALTPPPQYTTVVTL